MALVPRKCRCGKEFLAKEADVARGWAQSCSKSCAAKRRERVNTPSPAQLRARRLWVEREEERDEVPDWHVQGLRDMEAGWAGHKIWGCNSNDE